MSRWLTDEEVTELKIVFSPPNALTEVGGKWYFSDETWSHACGPFDSHEEARRAVLEYARSL